ncbi:hypothetical protein JCM8547_006550 [Rhodosporidiobolus lusitaniae]
MGLLVDLPTSTLPPRSSSPAPLKPFQVKEARTDYFLPSYERVPHRRASSASSSLSSLSSGGRFAAGGRKRAAILALAVLVTVGGLWRLDGRAGWRTSSAGEEEKLPPSLFTVEDGIVRLADFDSAATAATATAATLLENLPPFSSADQAPDPPSLPAENPPGLLPISILPSLLLPSPPLEHPLTLLPFSRLPSHSRWACLDAWVARGNLCPALEGSFAEGKDEEVKVDVAWTWTNGSEPRMARERKRVARELEEEEGGPEEGGNAAGVVRHFREHDELRYSIRSVLSSLPSSSLSSLLLVSGDLPAESFSSSTTVDSPDDSSSECARLLQVPTWLDSDRVDLTDDVRKSQLRLHSHSELFRTKGMSGSDEEAQGQAARWRDETAPSFSSRAIESQLPNLNTTSATLLSMNDDFFLLKPLSTGDIASPLTGPVFRMYREFYVEGVHPNEIEDDRDSEWKGLKGTNWMLNQRFGTRKRPYLAHVARSISVPLFREAKEVFFDAFQKTASNRFRGHGHPEITPIFLATHYILEKHREALLWSFCFARSDQNGDGLFSLSERKALLSFLLADNVYDEPSSALYCGTPRRTCLSSLSDLARRAGHPAPKETTLEFLSQDGFALFAADDAHDEVIPRWPGWPSFSSSRSDNEEGFPCAMRLDQCFGASFLDIEEGEENAKSIPVEEVFKRVAFERPECGDALIVLLMQKSGEKGVEAFLPVLEGAGEEEDEAGKEGTMRIETVGLEGTTWEEVSYAAAGGSARTRRKKALSLIQRYAYSIGSSPLSFLSVQSGGDVLSAMLNALHPLDPAASSSAFLALNDDIGTTDRLELEDIDERMKAWFKQEWPDPSEWEKVRG